MLDVSVFLLLLDFRARFSPSVAVVYDRRNTVTIHHLRSPGPSRFREIGEKMFAIKYELSFISR